jgi:hypothetical protein
MRSSTSNIRIPSDVFIQGIELCKNEKDQKELEKLKRTSGLRRFVDLDPYQLTRAQISALHRAAKEQKGEPAYKGELEFLYHASRNADSAKVQSIRALKPVLESFLQKDTIKGWVFQRAEYGALTPYLVKRIEYSAATKFSQEHVTIYLAYTDTTNKTLEKNVSISFRVLMEAYKAMDREAAENRLRALEEAEEEEDEVEDEDEEEMSASDKKAARERRKKADKAREDRLEKLATIDDGVPIERVLAQVDLYRENDELHTSYDKQFERFRKLISMYGAQLRVRGEGIKVAAADNGDEEDRWYYRWYSRSESMLVDSKPSRAIMDAKFQVDDGAGNRRKSARDEEEAEEIDITQLSQYDLMQSMSSTEVRTFNGKGTLEGTDAYLVPLHLELRIFHLEKHNFYKTHVVNLAPYKYKPEIKDHLILPAKTLKVANLLIRAENDEVEDVIEGKSQGRLITCIGDPGLGKTLLAEILSEAVGKPLYKFQAAQLGLDPETLEKRLRVLLHRAERWGCVVMIDEANAYIHDRGVDVHQNAIVGVFLRLLEYYRGTIIITTNQTNADGSDMDVDDAILSRSSAVIKFTLPDEDMSKTLWRLQAKLLKAKITDEVIDQAVNNFRFSGRSIRQLLRLTWSLCQEDGVSSIELKHLKEASEFIAVSRQERNEMKA